MRSIRRNNRPARRIVRRHESETADAFLAQLDRSDLIPPGVKEALSHVVYYRGVYRTYAERLYYLLRGAMKP